MRVLVVEDEPIIAAQLAESLGAAGYAVDVAESGSAAESFMAQGEYDLVVLDVMLPDQSGIDTARHFRRADGRA